MGFFTSGKATKSNYDELLKEFKSLNAHVMRLEDKFNTAKLNAPIASGKIKGHRLFPTEVNIFNYVQKLFVTNSLEDAYHLLVSNLDLDSVVAVNVMLKRLMLAGKYKKQTHEIFEEKELNQIEKVRKHFKLNILHLKNNHFVYKTYSLPRNHFEACVFYDEHSIGALVHHERVANKDIIDAGGFIGDSAIVLSKYTTKNVYSFEPNPSAYESLLHTLRLNKNKNIIPIQKGLGDKSEEKKLAIYGSSSSVVLDKEAGSIIPDKAKTENVSIVTLDDFVENEKLDIGLIKTDLEGAERDFLLGAEQTIRKHKPALLISIYHTGEDFFGIKPLLESWGVGYKFHIKKPLDGTVTREALLIAEVD